MCSIKEGFILCACDEDQLKDKDVEWILRRVDSSKPIHHKRGKIARPQINPDVELSKQAIVSQLNQRDCFDFDLTPQKNDSLMVRIKHKKSLLSKSEIMWVKFQFNGNEWQIDTSSPFAGWKTQLETYKSGKIQS